MDIILGDFVEANINDLNEQEIEHLQVILQQQDIDLYNWIINPDLASDEVNKPFLLKIQQWNKEKVKS